MTIKKKVFPRQLHGACRLARAIGSLGRAQRTVQTLTIRQIKHEQNIAEAVATKQKSHPSLSARFHFQILFRFFLFCCLFQTQPISICPLKIKAIATHSKKHGKIDGRLGNLRNSDAISHQ
jgi:hypothetical protein